METHRTREHSGSLPAEADVVIVGGGIIGASIAYHLASAGVERIVLLEAEELGSGSSGKPIGGIRAQFSDPLNIELGMRSLTAYRDFASRPGADIRLEQVGYLFLLTDEEQVEAFEASVALQQDFGVGSRMLSADEAHELCPYVPASSILAGAFSPFDGHARPVNALRGYVHAATALGATVLEGVRVTGISVEAGSIRRVETTDGSIATSAVICAAGAWSREIGQWVGQDLPVRPIRRQLCFTRPLTTPAPRIPFTLDFSTTAYFHNADDNALLFGYADPEQDEGFARHWDPDWLELFYQFAERRAPELAQMEVASGWAGLYEVTPDNNALIGESASTSRFLYATGFSGHGFLQAPAVGEAVRDLYLGRTPPVNIAPFDVARFADGARPVRPEINII